MKSFEEGSPTPHVLVELSDRELKRITDNCIHLKGVESCKSNGDLLYSSVSYGANIKKESQELLSKEILSLPMKYQFIQQRDNCFL